MESRNVEEASDDQHVTEACSDMILLATLRILMMEEETITWKFLCLMDLLQDFHLLSRKTFRGDIVYKKGVFGN